MGPVCTTASSSPPGLGKVIRPYPFPFGTQPAPSIIASGQEALAFQGLETKRTGLAIASGPIKTTDDLYRSLVSEWSLEAGIMPGISEDPTSQLDDPSARRIGADDPAMRMMVQDMRSYLPDDILCKVDRAQWVSASRHARRSSTLT